MEMKKEEGHGRVLQGTSRRTGDVVDDHEDGNVVAVAVVEQDQVRTYVAYYIVWAYYYYYYFLC